GIRDFHVTGVQTCALPISLVGRRSELEMLTGRWADACAGNGQVAILRGESGIGKSRLVHDLRGRLKAAGARLWALQCNPNGRQKIGRASCRAGGQCSLAE